MQPGALQTSALSRRIPAAYVPLCLHRSASVPGGNMHILPLIRCGYCNIFVALLLVTYIPAISMFLPGILGLV